jgi:hypothetical protein
VPAWVGLLSAILLLFVVFRLAIDLGSAHILRSPARLRRIISAPAFTKLFGPAEPLDVSSSSPKESKNSKKCKTAAGRVIQNIFGREDELKYAPKGIAKDHKHIDLLKCRSFAVAHR